MRIQNLSSIISELTIAELKITQIRSDKSSLSLLDFEDPHRIKFNGNSTIGEFKSHLEKLYTNYKTIIASLLKSANHEDITNDLKAIRDKISEIKLMINPDDVEIELSRVIIIDSEKVLSEVVDIDFMKKKQYFL